MDRTEERLGLDPLAAVLHPWGCSCLGSAGLACVLWSLLQPLSSGIPCSLPHAGKDQTQQQNPVQRCWRSIGQVLRAIPTFSAECHHWSSHWILPLFPIVPSLQMFRNMKGTWCREMISMFTKGGAEPEPPQPQSLAPAPSLDFFGDRVVSSPSQVSSLCPELGVPRNCLAPQASSTGPPQLLSSGHCGEKGSTSQGKLGMSIPLAALQVSLCLLQVPGFVRNMHQRFLSDEPPDDRLFMDILRLTDAHPNDVAVTLLRCASSCDKYRTHLP